MRKTMAVLLLAAMLLCIFTGCGENTDIGKTRALSDGISAKRVNTDSVTLNGDYAVSATDFAVRLFKECAIPGENTLISPVSVLYALSMTANGANGETKSQMETVLGAPVSELNDYLCAYMDSLPENEKYRLSIANSIWFTNNKDFTVNKDFLHANADYYGADIYQAPFDASTCDDINKWVEDKTDGMVKDILDEIPSDAIMYLVNALAFDAEWLKIYDESEVRDGSFTTEDGKTQDAKFMYSEESLYLEDENATGFIKYYADEKYAFAALLPDEGVTVDEYLSSMTGESLHKMLSNPQNIKVEIAIPKFESEYSTDMADILAAMGMPDAFNKHNADFTRLGASETGNIFISRVLHKTKIAVDEKGTKAGSSTAVEMKTESRPEFSQAVYLDRPFIYMLIDREANLPLFIGTMMDMD